MLGVWAASRGGAASGLTACRDGMVYSTASPCMEGCRLARFRSNSRFHGLFPDPEVGWREQDSGHLLLHCLRIAT